MTKKKQPPTKPPSKREARKIIAKLPPAKTAKRPQTSKKGRRTTWELVIKPNLEQIVAFYAQGATLKQIATYYGISKDTIFETLKKHQEFSDLITRARMNSEQELVGTLMKLARGEAERVETYRRKATPDSPLEITQRTIRLEPQQGATMALLKRWHGWSDNPVVDEAVAGALSAEEMRRKACQLLNIPDTGDKSKA